MCDLGIKLLVFLPVQAHKSYNNCFFYLFTGYYHKNIGLKQTGTPALNLNGYTRNLPSMPPRDIFQNPWPKCDAWVPIRREGRGEYYGYYHETIESERERRKKEYPTSWRIEPRDIPRL